MPGRRRTRSLRTGLLSPSLGLLLTVFIVVAPAVTSSTAYAAVWYCLPLMKANPAEGSTVTIAKHLALADWLRRATIFGVEYTRWGISWNHELICTVTRRGTTVCQAAGHPCAVRQVPPDNVISLRPGIVQKAANPDSLAKAGPIGERPGWGNPRLP
jgi:hypothetical protein